MSRLGWVSCVLVVMMSTGCAAQGAGLDVGNFDSTDGGSNFFACGTDLDCPAGLVCQAGVCVSPLDGRPPEAEATRTFLRPQASGNYVYVISPDASTVAVIDAETLGIRTVPVPEEPMALAVVPGSDTVIILSRRGKAISYLSVTPDSLLLGSQPVGRQYQAVDLSPDGRWAVLWTPDGNDPDTGAEGIIALVNTEALIDDAPEPVIERAAGRRHTDVVFRRNGLVYEDAVIVGSEEIAIVDLADPTGRFVPERVQLPDEYVDVHSREVVATEDGAYVMIRSFVSPDIAVFETATRSLRSLTLPGVATDLDVSRDGRLAVAAIRADGLVVHFPLPEGLLDPTLMVVTNVSPVVPGQLELSDDGRFGVIFTSTESTESLAWLDFGTGQLVVFDRLQKLVKTVGIAPGGRIAIVLHRPDPASTVSDPYEREVDQDEGYSLVDLESGFAQLKRTGGVPPVDFVFAPDGRHAAVTLSALTATKIDSIDLQTLVTDSIQLASTPQFLGALPAVSVGADRVWVTQAHPAGRISFVGLEERIVRTVTGYELNGEVITP